MNKLHTNTLSAALQFSSLLSYDIFISFITFTDKMFSGSLFALIGDMISDKVMGSLELYVSFS